MNENVLIVSYNAAVSENCVEELVGCRWQSLILVKQWIKIYW